MPLPACAYAPTPGRAAVRPGTAPLHFPGPRGGGARMPEPTVDRPDFAPEFSQLTPSEPPARPSREIEAWRLAFTGDGGVYFGVWLVNILLTIVTLGLFTPWARRRTVRYFYGHTLVAGSPLEFTAGIRGMVLGFLLLAAFYIALNVAAETGQ